MGQTVDIECGSDGCDDSIENCVPIRVPPDDPTFRDKKCLEFVRSEGVPDLDCSMGEARRDLPRPQNEQEQSVAFCEKGHAL